MAERDGTQPDHTQTEGSGMAPEVPAGPEPTVRTAAPPDPGDLATVQSEILLAEYRCLREELMFFVQTQRNSLNVLVFAAFGQAATFFVVEQQAILSSPFFFVSLFIIPLFIFIVMSRSLDATARILVIADYIHKGLKPRMAGFFDTAEDYFFWEEHKAASKRVHPWLLHVLDRSKWLIFCLGIAASFAVSIWVSMRIDTGFPTWIAGSLQRLNWIDELSPWARLPDILVLGALLNVAYIGIAVVAGNAFEETTGESRFKTSSHAPKP